MKRLLTYFLLSILIGVSAPVALVAKTSASFSSHKVMTDSVFTDYSSMSASQIDSFLNRFSSSCISPSSGFRSPDVIGYSPSSGFKYGGNVTAGTIIYHAAQAYHMNPRVILATLQKEQSLVSGTAGCHQGTPSTFKCNLYGNGSVDCVSGCHYSGGCYYIAMGYDCPSNCAKSSVGFSVQIIKAVWKLKFNQQRSLGNVSWAEVHGNWNNSDDPFNYYDGPMTQGYRARVKGGSSTYYDGYTHIESSTVHMDTGATAALYYYTPFFHGNQLFVNIFENWFGSTQKNLPTLADTEHPDGTLVKTPENDAVYLIVNQQLYHVPSPAFFNSHGYQWSEVRPATVPDQALPKSSSDLTFDSGTLVRGNNDSKIYLLQCDVTNCVKLHITTAEIFRSLGFNFSEVLIVGQARVDGYTTGTPITSDMLHPKNVVILDKGTGKVYLISVNQKRWVPNLNIFKANHFSWSKVRQATAGDIALSSGSDVTYPEGALARVNNSPDTFAIDINENNSNAYEKRLITDQSVFTGLGYGSRDVYVDSSSVLPSSSGSNIAQ